MAIPIETLGGLGQTGTYMSEIQKAFDAGNYAVVRRLAREKPSAEASKLLERTQIDKKIIWAGLFGLIVTSITALMVLS